MTMCVVDSKLKKNIADMIFEMSLTQHVATMKQVVG